jgi:hypothetical protein
VYSQAVNATVWEKENFQEVLNIQLMMSCPADICMCVCVCVHMHAHVCVCERERERERESMWKILWNKEIREISSFSQNFQIVHFVKFVIYVTLCCKISDFQIRILWNKVVETFRLLCILHTVYCNWCLTGLSLPTQNDAQKLHTTCAPSTDVTN